MADTISNFFDDLNQRGHVPSIRRLTGTFRIDLKHRRGVDHWHVTVDRGDVTVARRNLRAECVLSTDRKRFGEIATGRLNALTAVLRGVLAVEGDPSKLVLFQRVFPGPPPPREEGRDDVSV